MSRFRRFVIAVSLFVLVVSGAFAAYQVADSSQDEAATTTQTKTNETLTQQVGTWQLVSESTDQYTAGFNDSVTVYNSSGTELTAGEDYVWNASDGAIKFLDTSSTSDGSSANITYQYQRNTEAVREAAGPLTTVVTGIGVLPVMAAGIGFMVLLITLGQIVLHSTPGGR